MRFVRLSIVGLAIGVTVWPQDQITTVGAVLKRYQEALGGADAIKKVQSETRRGELEAPSLPGKATFVFRNKPFQTVRKITLADGREITSGFDGKVSWSATPQGASIDKAIPLDALRRDADLEYPLHQEDYFRKLEFAGITDFEARPCYWLHGVTRWGKDNNQFYDVQTGLLAGYRFQSDDSSAGGDTTMVFQDYKSFGGPLVATKVISRTAGRTQSTTYTSVTYEPLADSIFELPQAVRALLGKAK